LIDIDVKRVHEITVNKYWMNTLEATYKTSGNWEIRIRTEFVVFKTDTNFPFFLFQLCKFTWVKLCIKFNARGFKLLKIKQSCEESESES